MIVWARRLAAVAATMTVMAMAAAVAQPAAQPDASAAQQQLLRPEELDQLVAPIALYPDNLLSEVLMAATYPLEVVQADRWATENKNLKGDALSSAVQKLTWDGSVKALLATPSVLTMMSTKLDWTQKLGDTVLAQQPDVMDAIQRLRAKAQANNKLTSTKEQKVEVRQEQNKQVIVIEPAVPETVYVPYYDPGVVYGAWPYPAYPPYYFPAPGYVAGGIIATGIAFGAGYAVGRWASGGNYWGGGVNWGGNNIYVNRPVNINNINNGGNNWQHNPEHRHGVKYTNQNVQQKFSNNNLKAGAQDRLDYRGRSGEQVLRPSGDRGGNLGDRGPGDRGPGDRTPGDRPGAGNRTPGDRPAAGNRTPGDRPGAGDRGPGDRRPEAGNRPAAGGNRPGRDNAFDHVQSSGKLANAQSHRGQASLGGGGGGGARAAAAGRGGGGGGGARAAAAGRGGGGGAGRGGGGRGGRR
jgi:hypothetical protein